MLTVDRRPESALPASAPAKRAQRARWRDPRLLIGVALVVVAMAAGAVLMGGGGAGVSLVRATRDLPVGAIVGADDLELVSVDLVGTQAYLTDPQPGDVVVRSVLAGELVPINALAEAMPADVRMVTVPVEPLHAPPGLAAGARVDVWLTADAEGAVPQLALADAMVVAVSTDIDNSTGQLGVVLQVAPQDAAQVVVASRGAVDLVARPAMEDAR